MTRTACPDDRRRYVGLEAIVLDEPDADRCEAVLLAATTVAISAGTLAEALIVAGRRSVALQMTRLVEGVGMEVVPLTSATTRCIADAYARWGKGIPSRPPEPRRLLRLRPGHRACLPPPLHRQRVRPHRRCKRARGLGKRLHG